MTFRRPEMRVLCGLWVIAAALSSLAPTADPQRVQAQAGKPAGGPFVSPAVTPLEFEGRLDDLPRAPAWSGGATRQGVRIVHASASQPRLPLASGPDPLVGPVSGPVSGILAPPFRNFPGAGYTGVDPSDTNGDAGPNHYIQMINDYVSSVIRIYDKAVPTPNLLVNTTLQAVWTASGGTGICSTGGLGDPIVLWDSLADRWLLSELAQDVITGQPASCVMISRTPDPVGGGWYLYEFHPPEFPDYEKFAVWPDAYLMTANESAPAAYAFDRLNMLGGHPASFVRFTAPPLGGFTAFQALTPADIDGPVPPPLGAPGIFMRHDDDEAHNPPGNPAQDYVQLFFLSVNWITPSGSTFSGPLSIPVAEFNSNLCGLTSFNCIAKPGVPTGSFLALDPLREIVMWRLVYRSLGGVQHLIGNFVTDVTGSNQAGIRWFDLQNTGAGWTLAQEGTYVGPTGVFDSVNRWTGSLAMDGAGNIALGYSVSSETVYPGIRYTGRLAGDPPGQMPQGEFTIVNATANNGSFRWGDYSAMAIDPSDDCTFWYTQNFGRAGFWATEIASFDFAGDCALPDTADVSVTKTDRVIRVAQGGALTYWIIVSNPGPQNAPGVTVTDTFPPEIASALWTCAITGTGSCAAASGTGAISTTVDLDAGSFALFTVQARVSPSAAVGTLIANCARATFTSAADPDSANNLGCDTNTRIVPGPAGQGTPGSPASGEPAINKTGALGPGQFGLPGESITWTITVTAPPSGPLTHVWVADTVIPQLRIDSASATTGGVTVNGQTVTLTIPYLAAGSSAALTVSTTILGVPDSGLFTNTAALTADGGVSQQASAVVQGVTGLPGTGYPPDE